MKKITFDEFNNIKNMGNLVASFGAPWCRDCKFVEPILEELEKEFKNINFYFINVDENEGVRDVLGIRHIPTIFFLKDGKEICDRLVEPKSLNEIKEKLLKF